MRKSKEEMQIRFRQNEEVGLTLAVAKLLMPQVLKLIISMIGCTRDRLKLRKSAVVFSYAQCNFILILYPSPVISTSNVAVAV